jgi:hypothetical protein
MKVFTAHPADKGAALHVTLVYASPAKDSLW